MYNELNVKEKEKDACLIWPKMMVFFIPTFFFKYDWFFLKEYDIWVDPPTPLHTHQKQRLDYY